MNLFAHMRILHSCVPRLPSFATVPVVSFKTWTCASGIACRRRYLKQCGGLQLLLRSSSSSLKRRLPFEIDTNVQNDIMVYSFKNDRFYKLLTYFGCAQFAFWAYLATFSFQNLRDAPEDTKPLDSWWRRMAAKESKYKNGISVLCFAFGYIVLCISILYPMRAVKKLWLLKGGTAVRVDTFSPLRRTQTLTVATEDVSCLQSRRDAAAQIAMKIRGRWLFFLLDKRGTFHEADLFDYAVGLNRKVK